MGGQPAMSRSARHRLIAMHIKSSWARIAIDVAVSEPGDSHKAVNACPVDSASPRCCARGSWRVFGPWPDPTSRAPWLSSRAAS
jgi:hypothetical protein